MLATLRCAVSGARSCGAAPLLLRIDLRSYGKGEKKWAVMLTTMSGVDVCLTRSSAPNLVLLASQKLPRRQWSTSRATRSLKALSQVRKD